jgi:hypothetical protein
MVLMPTATTRPSSGASLEPAYEYNRWLCVAENGIEKGLNPNAVWRLHEKVARRQHYDGHYELGGEA